MYKSAPKSVSKKYKESKLCSKKNRLLYQKITNLKKFHNFYPKTQRSERNHNDYKFLLLTPQKLGKEGKKSTTFFNLEIYTDSDHPLSDSEHLPRSYTSVKSFPKVPLILAPPSETPLEIYFINTGNNRIRSISQGTQELDGMIKSRSFNLGNEKKDQKLNVNPLKNLFHTINGKHTTISIKGNNFFGENKYYSHNFALKVNELMRIKEENIILSKITRNKQVEGKIASSSLPGIKSKKQKNVYINMI